MRSLVSTSSSLSSCSGSRRMTSGSSRASAAPPLPLTSFGGGAPSRRLHLGSCRPRSTNDNDSNNLRLRPLFASPPRSDEVLRTLSESSEISVLAVDGTRLVSEATRRHGTAPTASAALGRALLGGLLLSAFKGEGEATQITFKGTGPLGGLQVVAEATGAVKGRVDNPAADPPLRADGKLDVGGAVGGGVLAIVRSREGGGEAYTGLTQIVSGEIADDLAHYLATSEQINCALALGVSLDKTGQVKAAGGFLVQALPLCSEATLVSLERNISALPAVSSFFLPEAGDSKNGTTAGTGGVAGLTAALLEGIGAAPGPGFSLAPRYGPCEKEGLRQRMVRAAALLGETEVRAALEANSGVMEMRCEFCQEAVEFEAEEVLEAARAAATEKQRDGKKVSREGGGGGGGGGEQ